MTPQETIETIKIAIAEVEWNYPMGYAVAFENAIKTLEKQIPKKPIDDRYPWCICPTCNGSVYVKHIQEHIHNEETTYCEHCGQALDWSDTE